MPLLLLGLALGGGYLWYRNRPIWGLFINSHDSNQAYVTDLNAGMDADRNQKVVVDYTINPDGSAIITYVKPGSIIHWNSPLTITAKNIFHF